MPKGFHHLTQDQRCQIDALKTSGLSIRAISRQLNVAPSTISRELKRNGVNGCYNFKNAQKISSLRRYTAHSRPKKWTEAIKSFVIFCLGQKWSPTQINGWLQKLGLDCLSDSMIYKYLKKDRKEGGKLYQDLRHRGKKYKTRAKKEAGVGLIKNRVGIEHRPKIVEEKSRFGDFEIDLIVGAGQSGYIISMVNRMTKYVDLRII